MTQSIERIREVNRAATRRYRARQRGEDVPKIDQTIRDEQYWRDYHIRYRQEHPEVYRRADRAHYAKRRKAVFDHYGWTCACCGSAKRPTIDHINGDGDAHRIELFGSSAGGAAGRMYRWLSDNGFPAGFQTLCLPCNQSKGGQLSKDRSGQVRENGHCLLHEGGDAG